VITGASPREATDHFTCSQATSAPLTWWELTAADH
jgi:hypothetical protein